MYFEKLLKGNCKVSEKALNAQLDAIIKEREKTDPMDAETRNWIEAQRKLIPQIVSGEMQVKDADFIAEIHKIITCGKVVSVH